MKVLYDISVLVSGNHVSGARTGVFRVAEHVARGLAVSKDCDVTFCITDRAIEPLNFLREDPDLLHVPLSLTRGASLWRMLYGKVFDLTKVIESGATAASVLPLKALRKLTYHTAEALKQYSQPFDPKLLPSVDIYHSPFYPIPPLAKAAPSVKRFLTVNDLIPVLYPQFFESYMTRLMKENLASLGEDDFAICISQGTKNDLCNHLKYLNPARVFVTHLAASEMFHPCPDSERAAEVRKKYGIPAEVRYFLSLSTLEPRKNIDRVVKCFARLVREQRIKDLRLVLTGKKGWDYDKIFAAVSDFENSSEYIILTGYVPDEDLAALYSGAHAFVYPSLYEGFGLPPLEAMQCGTPVISSNTSSLPEVVGDAGILVDPTDEDAICQSMLDLYRDGNLRAELSRKSLERARQFSWKRCTRETLAAYKFALGR